jgi:hypothetical protein
MFKNFAVSGTRTHDFRTPVARATTMLQKLVAVLSSDFGMNQISDLIVT